MEVIKNAFNKTCKWCGLPRFILPKGILICNKCDKVDNETIIPNDTGLSA
jgi:hypothetical protein